MSADMRVDLTITSGPFKGGRFEFAQPDCLLFGKASDARVVIAGDNQVSRNHFTLLIAPPVCRIRDHSSNGTYVGRGEEFVRYGGKNSLPAGAVGAVNGATEVELKDGDEISVGKTRIRVQIEVPSDVTEIQISAPDAFDGTVAQAQAPQARAKTEVTPLSDPGATMRAAGAQSVPTLKNHGDNAAFAFRQAYPNAPVFPGYRNEALLGKGGMGAVVKATQVATGRVVAIKTMLPRGGADVLLKAFEREISVQSKLKHANIVELIGLERAEKALGVVLELVDGPDLSKLVKDRGGRLPLVDAAPIMLGALAGLGHAHAMGIVHRDLKPENIFLARTADGWVPKVADFGLAKSYEASGKSLFDVAGTPPFWPREHLTDYAHLYPASDVFSIAAVFYWMLTGVHARGGMSEMLRAKPKVGFGDYAEVICSGHVIPIRERDASIPAPVAEVLDRALHEKEMGKEVMDDKNALRAALAEMRYPNAGAFRDALALASKKASN